MSKGGRFLRDNSLSLTLLGLFLCSLAGCAVVGWINQNQMLAEHHHPPIRFAAYLISGSFLQGLAVNWQAAFLQLGTLIVFSAFFFQRGAPHSRSPDRPKRKHRARGVADWLWRHSLALAFGLLFLAAFAIDIVSGTSQYNEQLVLHGASAPVSLWRYVVSARFWWKTLQTWQAEYLVIVLYIILSIFFRQEDSAESKPPEDSNRSTGEHNE